MFAKFSVQHSKLSIVSGHLSVVQFFLLKGVVCCMDQHSIICKTIPSIWYRRCEVVCTVEEFVSDDQSYPCLKSLYD